MEIEEFVGKKSLVLAVDMYGCPNRCRHCWLGNMPNKKMNPQDDAFIMDYFRPFFKNIAFYSWIREPDYCDDYRHRWRRDNDISVGIRPQRFELASFYRLVRDKDYVKFLKEVDTKTVQLTFFGLESLTDKYIGRKGAYTELLTATDILLQNGIVPRWQAFINEENKDEMIPLLRVAEKLCLKERCENIGGKFTFFIHSGSCDGENYKLYSKRITKASIPREIIPNFLNFDKNETEAELCERLLTDDSYLSFAYGDTVVLYISNTFDVYFNFTHMKPDWVIGNLYKDSPEELMYKIINKKVKALEEARQITIGELVSRYGDKQSQKLFEASDYKIYLLLRHLEALNKNK